MPPPDACQHQRSLWSRHTSPTANSYSHHQLRELLPPARDFFRVGLTPQLPIRLTQTYADSQKLRHELLHSLDRLESRLGSQHTSDDCRNQAPQPKLGAAAARAGAIEALQALLAPGSDLNGGCTEEGAGEAQRLEQQEQCKQEQPSAISRSHCGQDPQTPPAQPTSSAQPSDPTESHCEPEVEGMSTVHTILQMRGQLPSAREDHQAAAAREDYARQLHHEAPVAVLSPSEQRATSPIAQSIRNPPRDWRKSWGASASPATQHSPPGMLPAGGSVSPTPRAPRTTRTSPAPNRSMSPQDWRQQWGVQGDSRPDYVTISGRRI